MRLALFDQEHAGIDIVTDGEQTRRHFVTTFIEGLDGVDFANKKTVRIRNRYDADVPMVVGPVARRHPIYVDDARFLRGETDRKVKYTLPGPMTMVDTLYDGHYKSREKLAWAFAEILNEEARAIEAAGVDVIQFDEPAFNVYFDEVRDWGVAALERAAQGLSLHHRRPHLLRLRHQGQQRLEEDAGLGVAAIRADVPAAGASRASTRFRSNARTPMCRSTSSACWRARTCWSVPSTSPATVVETPEDVAADHSRRAAVRSRRTALSVHELRHGAAVAGRGAGQARGPGRRRRPGPGRIGALSRRPEPSRHARPYGQRGLCKPANVAYTPKGVLFQVLKHVFTRSKGRNRRPVAVLVLFCP